MNRQAVQTLKTYFGYDTFREGQESVVESILEHRDVLDHCAQLLIQKEKITGDEFEALFQS